MVFVRIFVKSLFVYSPTYRPVLEKRLDKYTAISGLKYTTSLWTFLWDYAVVATYLVLERSLDPIVSLPILVIELLRSL
jgi:hypothetical protein